MSESMFHDVCNEIARELHEQNDGEFGLGISHDDILKAFKSLYSMDTVAVPPAPHLDAAKLANYLRDAQGLLNDHQLEALRHINFVANHALDISPESRALHQGYLLYLRMANDTDKFCGRLNYSFEDMVSNAPHGDYVGQGVFRLRDVATSKLGLLSEVALGLKHAIAPIERPRGRRVIDPWITNGQGILLQAGIGLAYVHCYEVLAAHSEEAYELAKAE